VRTKLLFVKTSARFQSVYLGFLEHLMAATAQQTFVAQQGFEQKDVQSTARSSGNVTQAEFTSTSLPHGIVVAPSTISHTVGPHPSLPQTTVTLAVQAPQIQQNQSLQQAGTAQIIAASVLSPEEFQANAAITKEGIHSFTTTILIRKIMFLLTTASLKGQLTHVRPVS
jgi:hypothetical protein